MQPGLDKCFLRGIFCDLCIAAHAINDVPDALCMEANKLAECVSFTGLRPINKLYLVDCRHSAISLS